MQPRLARGNDLDEVSVLSEFTAKVLRSLTLGTGAFHRQDNHLQKVPEKVARQVLARQ